MTDVDSLRSSIAQYELQLVQVQQSLSHTPEGSDRENLMSLQSDIQELIALTKESLKSAEGKNTSENEDDGLSDDSLDDNDDDDDPLAKEYAAFKAELEEEKEGKDVKEDADEDDSDDKKNVEDELKSVEGMKCRAPFINQSGANGYHNAIISSIITDNTIPITNFHEIKVKVFFINPTQKKMLPCSYFLDGFCKFSDEKCHFSHGEIVLFSALQEYREPDFEGVKLGSRVLAKDKTGIWHRSIVLKESEGTDDLYRVKLENGGQILEVKIDNLLLIDDIDLQSETFDSELTNCDDDDNDENNIRRQKDELIHKSLMTLDSKEPLGKWEEHTKGIGSKLMAQMGYVRGTGLGKLSDGRVNPVEAQILPAGKSLDHCMKLKENAGADEDLFSVEKRLQKQKAKLDVQRQKQYLKDLQKAKEKNVFQFINDTLRDKDDKFDSKASSSEMKKQLKGETSRNLNVVKFKTEEDITKLEKESVKLKQSLGKQLKGSISFNNIITQYNDKQNELCKLKSKLKNINDEQNHRKDKAKLSIF